MTAAGLGLGGGRRGPDGYCIGWDTFGAEFPGTILLFSLILTSDSVKYSRGNIAWSIGTRVVVVVVVVVGVVVGTGGKDDGCAGFVGLGGLVGGSVYCMCSPMISFEKLMTSSDVRM